MALCFGKKASKSQIIIKHCKSLSNMIDALNYYRSLEMNLNDEATINMAMEIYFTEEYKNFLNDYNHTIYTHSEHLEEIHEQLGGCKFSGCKMVQRYMNENRRKTTIKIDDNKSNENAFVKNNKTGFFLELVDIIHYWLYHQYDVGMRIKSSIFDGNFKHDAYNDGGFFDASFAAMQQEILKKKGSLNTNRFNQKGQTNKFKLQVNENSISHTFTDEKLLIDVFVQNLKQEEVPFILIS